MSPTQWIHVFRCTKPATRHLKMTLVSNCSYSPENEQSRTCSDAPTIQREDRSGVIFIIRHTRLPHIWSRVFIWALLSATAVKQIQLSAVCSPPSVWVPLNDPGPSQGFFLLKGSYSCSVAVLRVCVTHIERLLTTTDAAKKRLNRIESVFLVSIWSSAAPQRTRCSNYHFPCRTKHQILTERAFPFGRCCLLPVCHNDTLCFQLLCQLQ